MSLCLIHPWLPPLSEQSHSNGWSGPILFRPDLLPASLHPLQSSHIAFFVVAATYWRYHCLMAFTLAHSSAWNVLLDVPMPTPSMPSVHDHISKILWDPPLQTVVFLTPFPAVHWVPSTILYNLFDFCDIIWLPPKCQLQKKILSPLFHLVSLNLEQSMMFTKYLLHIHVLGIAQLGMHKDEMSNLHDTSHGTLSLGLVGGKSLHWPNPTTTLSGATSGPCTQ